MDQTGISLNLSDDQIGRGEGLTGNKDCCYIPALPVECPMTPSVQVAGDISKMSTSPLPEPKHTKGPLCFQVLMWKADGK